MIEPLLKMIGYHTPTMTEKLAAWAGPAVIQGGKSAAEWTLSTVAAYVGIVGGLKVGAKVTPIIEKGVRGAFKGVNTVTAVATGVFSKKNAKGGQEVAEDAATAAS